MDKQTYHDQKAMKNPRYEKKKTRPYLSTGLKIGMDFAFFVMGFTSGALQSCLSSKPMLLICGTVDIVCGADSVEIDDWGNLLPRVPTIAEVQR